MCSFCPHCRQRQQLETENSCSDCRINRDIIEKWDSPVQILAKSRGWKDKDEVLSNFSRCRHNDERYLAHKANGSCGHKGWIWCYRGEAELRTKI